MTAGQNTEVLLRLPDGYAQRYLLILEQPSLHIIGDHLWHSSIVLAQYILNGHLDGALQGRQIVELGAGCGLLSLAASARLLLSDQATSKIIATDLKEVVNSTLQESLLANSALAINIQPLALDWGTSDLSLPPGKPLTILASDVLYNADSHEIFLDTLLAMYKLAGGDAIVYIAYRHRIAGDDRFWELARESGLVFGQIHQLADIQIWQCT